jgi:hypothetical protein
MRVIIHRTKLTENNVRHILAAGPEVTNRELADHYQVSPETICNIRAGQTWEHITNRPAKFSRFVLKRATKAVKRWRAAAENALFALEALQQDRKARKLPDPPGLAELISLAGDCCGGRGEETQT